MDEKEFDVEGNVREVNKISKDVWSNKIWYSKANCRDKDPSIFFPDRYSIDLAKDICNKCSVKNICLAYSVKTNELNGIWGGATEKERRSMRIYINALKKANTLKESEENEK